MESSLAWLGNNDVGTGRPTRLCRAAHDDALEEIDGGCSQLLMISHHC